MNFFGDTISITGYQLTIGNVIPSSDITIPTFTLELDNVTMQQVGFNNVVTQQPTTRGTPISDNIYRLPIQYQVEGLLSPGTVTNSFDIPNLLSYFNYLSTRFSNVQAAALNTYLFNINTGFATFPTMAMLSCISKQEVDAFNALKYIMTFQEAIQAPSTVNQTQNNYNRIPANRGKINV